VITNPRLSCATAVVKRGVAVDAAGKVAALLVYWEPSRMKSVPPA
jgi:hypothetical protein